MADESRQSQDSDAFGVRFKDPASPQKKDVRSPVTELYGRSLSSITTPGRPPVHAAFNVENGLSGKAGETGTFVSDRKKDRPSFLENVVAAFAEWRSMVTRSFSQNKIVEETNDVKEHAETENAKTPDVGEPHIPHLTALKSETIASRTSSAADAKHHVRRSSTMRDVTQAVNASKESTPSPLSTSSSAKHELKKVRTFKSDAEMLRANTAIPAPQPVDVRPEPAPVVHPAPEEETKKEDIHVAPIDMRISMIAPEVDTRISVEELPITIETQQRSKEGSVDAVAPHIPPVEETTSLREPAPETPPKGSEMPREDVVQWTHMRETDEMKDEPSLAEIPSATPMEGSGAHSPAPDLPFITSHAPEQAVPHEDRSARITERLEKLRSTEHTPSIDTESLPPLRTGPDVPFTELPLSELSAVVKPDVEPAPSTDPSPEVSTPVASAPPAVSVFHERIEPEHDPVAPKRVADVPQARPASAPLPRRSVTPRSSWRFAVRLILVMIVTGAVAAGGIYVSTRVKPDMGTLPHQADPISDTPVTPVERSYELLLAGDAHAFRTDMYRMVEDAASGLIEFDVYTGTPPRTATTQELFAQLDTGLPARTIRSLEPVFVTGSVTTTHNEPFILIRSNNFDALFAGLLAWEPSMQEDLAPLFGSTAHEARPFEDAVQDNSSVRILRGADDSEIMLYSFIDPRTVVITRSGEALAKLIEHF